MTHGVLQIVQVLTNFVKQDKKKKSHLFITPWLHWKSLYGRGSCQVYKFSRIVIFVWKGKFYHWQQVWSTAFIEATGSFYLFFYENISTYPCLSKRNLSVTLSSKNSIPWEKQLVHLTIRTTLNCLSSWRGCTSLCYRSVLRRVCNIIKGVDSRVES